MPFIPDHFAPPTSATFQGLSLSVLSPEFADQDFAAVTASADSIRHVFGPDNDWPAADMTYDENLADLARHAREFEERSAFAYAVFDERCARYLGCLYLKPIKSKMGRDSRQELFVAQAFLWFSSRHQDIDRESTYAAIASWIADSWPIGKVVWPGRAQSWEAWQALAKRPANAA